MRTFARLGFILIAILGATKIAQGNSRVNWNPDSLSLQCLTGTTSSVPVIFTASDDLTDVDLSFSLTLRRFLSVTPSHFDAVAANTEITVAVGCNIAENAVIRNRTGRLFLRRSSDSDDESRRIGRALPISLTVMQPTTAAIPDGISRPSADRFVTDSTTNLNYAKDEIDVFVQPGTSQDDVVSLASRFGATFLGNDAGLELYQLLIPFQDLSAALSLISQLELEPIVSSAIPGFFILGTAATKIPNDPSWSDPAKSWAQQMIQLPEAWFIDTGAPALKLGVVDAGFDTNHIDLTIDRTGSITLPGNSATMHGTAVASLAAAQGDNMIGLAGAMWNSDLFLFDCGGGTDLPTDFVYEPLCLRMMREAADKGVRIINYSIGQDLHPDCRPNASIAELHQWAKEERDAYTRVFRYADKVPGGILFVIAAGNDAKTFVSTFPAQLSMSIDNVVSVGAVNILGNQASYSNFGPLSVWAPGGDDSVTICPGGLLNHTSPSSDEIKGIWAAKPGSSFGFVNPGTSFAAPFVAGVAGLMLSLNPSLTAAQLKSIIHDTSTLTGQSDPDGNPILLLNAFSAVQQASHPASRFVYVANSGVYPTVPGNISAYLIDFNTGGLTQISGSSFAAELETDSITVHPTGRFVYVANGGSGSISAYAINAGTGALTPVPGSAPSGYTPSSIIVEPTGKFAYVTNAASDSVSAYTIDAASGALTPFPGLPVSTGHAPQSIAVDPFGRYAYVANGLSNDVWVYSIDPTAGTLTPVAGGPFPSGFSPTCVTVHPSGNFVYVTNLGHNISAYAVDPATGSLTPISGSPFPAGTNPLAIVVDPSGRFAYVADVNLGVIAYSIDIGTGALAELPDSPFRAGLESKSVTVDSSGNFVYVVNEGSNNVSAYAVDPATGSLTPISGSPFPAGTSPMSVTTTVGP